MLFMVMVLGSVIMMIASLASLLMNFELKQATDVEATGQAIFAADTGVECAIYQEFYDTPLSLCACDGNSQCQLDNGSLFSFKRESEIEKTLPSGAKQTIITWTSVGTDSEERVSRAFEIKFEELVE